MHNESVRSNVSGIPIHFSYTPEHLRTLSLPRVLCQPHIHSEVELLYVESGVFSCIIYDTEIIAKKGDVIYIAGLTPHYTKTLEEGTYTALLQFSPMKFTDAKDGISKYLYRFMNTEEVPFKLFSGDDVNTASLVSSIERICKEAFEDEPGRESFIKAQVYSVLGILERSRVLRTPENYFDSKSLDKILPALSYIDEHYAEDISLDFLSNLLNINRYYFCRLFKEATNSTFKEYLNFVRICKSEKLLTSSEMTVSEISLESGYSSISHFSRTFKHFKGCSPHEFKKLQHKRQ